MTPALWDITVDLPEYGPICLDLRETVCHSLFLRGYYSFRDPPDIQLLKLIVAPGMTVFDIGANIGYYAKAISTFLKTSGRVVCVEPMPRALNLLQRTAKFFELPCFIESAAVGESRGVATLRQNQSLDVSTVVFTNTLQPHNGSTIVVSIDDLCEKYGPPDVIKLDVEGAELLALRGARNLLQKARVIVLFEHIPTNARGFGGYSIDNIVACFPDSFRVFRIGKSQTLHPYRQPSTRSTTDDYLAIPRTSITQELAARIVPSKDC